MVLDKYLEISDKLCIGVVLGTIVYAVSILKNKALEQVEAGNPYN